MLSGTLINLMFEEKHFDKIKECCKIQKLVLLRLYSEKLLFPDKVRTQTQFVPLQNYNRPEPKETWRLRSLKLFVSL